MIIFNYYILVLAVIVYPPTVGLLFRKQNVNKTGEWGREWCHSSSVDKSFQPYKNEKNKPLTEFVYIHDILWSEIQLYK